MMTPKQQQTFGYLQEKLEKLAEIGPNEFGAAVNQAISHASRLINRSCTPDDAERVEYIQTKGPTIEFTGRQIYEAEYQNPVSRDTFALELWRTLSGKLVAVDIASFADGNERVTVHVRNADEEIALMDDLGWSANARNMAKKMKWILKVEVE
jgi:hypothetical protein